MPIRPATAADRDAVIALWEEGGLVRPWNDAAADFALALDGGAASTVLVAEEVPGCAPAGTVMCGHDGHRGWIYYLAVGGAHRRAGLGTALVRAAESWLRDAGAPKVNLMVRGDNAAVVAFYEAIGYALSDVVVLGRRLDGGSPDP